MPSVSVSPDSGPGASFIRYSAANCSSAAISATPKVNTP